MAKRTVSFGDYEAPTYEDYTGEDPPAGKWFTGVVKMAKYVEDGDQMMFVVEIQDEDSPYRGWGRGYYGDFDGTTKWKLQEMLRALQGGKIADVTVDWEKEAAVALWLKKQKTTIKFQTREYNDKITIGKVRPLMEAVTGGKAPAKVAPAPEVEADEPEGDEALEDYTAEELAAMKIDDLEEILTDEFESDLPKKLRNAAAYKKKVVDAILEAQEEGDEEEEEPEGEEPADDDFDDEFADGDPDEDDEEEEEEEPEPEPEPAPTRRRRSPAPAKAAPAKAAPAARRRRS